MQTNPNPREIFLKPKPTLNHNDCAGVMDHRQNELTMYSPPRPLGIGLEACPLSRQPNRRKMIWRISVIGIISLAVVHLVVTAAGLVFMAVVKLFCAWFLWGVMQDRFGSVGGSKN